ncbi:MAG TPA: PilZ domain-containing protein [Thermoanaerobaculia bacterium]|nr:PilZ domain-containing protein [Thermoanaerobaculia bacterium]
MARKLDFVSAVLLGASAAALTREELAQALNFPPSALEALIAGGGLNAAGDRISLQEVERFLQSALLRVYHAEVESGRVVAPGKEKEKDEITIDLPEPKSLALVAEPADSGVVHSIAEYEASLEPTDNRVSPRFKPKRQVGGTFGNVKFAVLQMSENGLRIRHDETLLPGEEARMSIALVRPQQSVVVKARVVWTSIAQRGDGPTFCISGVRVTENEDRLQRTVAMLKDARELEPEKPPGSRGTSRDETPSALRGMSDDEVAAILRAVRKFADDPIEANRWYARGRFATSEESVRQALQQHARDREQVLGVWEYLERRIDLRKVAGVVSWMRSTRAAAV